MKPLLDHLYETLNRREYLSPDPLELVYEYESARDREVVGLIASSLAYGRVRQILASARRVLERLGPEPARFVTDESASAVRGAVEGIRHRFTGSAEIADLLVGAGGVIRAHGSLERCFSSGTGSDGATTLPALGAFVSELSSAAGRRPASLLPSPERGSACKRLHLFLRWMVRSDEVDPGVWTSVDAATLVIPLDTHMHRIASGLGLTARSQADCRTALEVTDAFRRYSPADPVRYDFALTRTGIRKDCRDMLDARRDEVRQDPKRSASQARKERTRSC